MEQSLDGPTGVARRLLRTTAAETQHRISTVEY